MQWDLSVLYNGFDDARIEADFTRAKTSMDALNVLLAAPGETVKTLEKAVALIEDMGLCMSKLGSFANLTLATDANNEPATQLMDRAMQFSVGMELAYSGYARYVGTLSKAALEEAIGKSDMLKTVDFSLRRTREDAEHLLPDTVQELALNLSLTGAEAFSQLRDKLDATVLVDYDGKQIPLSAARALAEDADPAVRKAAYEAELAAYAKIELPMAACLNAIKGEGLTLLPYKHFDSILAETLFDSNMDAQTLDAMWTAICEYLPVFRRYLRKKGELLGHRNGLPFYDLFAPVRMGDQPARAYTVEEARAILVREMSKFTPEMGAFIDNAFESRWIDMFPREGKSGGAFCAGLEHCEQSRVLTNFTGSLGDVSTLAHELGHAWHNRCMRGLPLCMRSEPMPLAETASIFNETLLSGAMLKTASPEEAFTLIESDLQNSTQVCVDIYSRFLFESSVIEARKTHTLSVSELKQLMLDAQEKSYGDGLDPDARHPYMWACKSHYYIPGMGYYNFPYAFGLLFGKGVYALYEKEGAAFVPRYNALLRACGSGMITDVAGSVGIDVRSVDFWRASLSVIEKEIDRFCALADQQLKG